MHRQVRAFTARRIDDRIVLETTQGEMPRMRWSFADIRADSFTWRNEIWTGSGWHIQQTFDARRLRQPRTVETENSWKSEAIPSRSDDL